MGAYSYGAIAIHFENPSVKCSVGKFCSIAAGCAVYLGGDHRMDRASTFPFGHIHTTIFPGIVANNSISKGSVVIQNDVWIGANATIMSGVTVGNGAVIANNAHVVKDVPPYAIVGGNPAKVIRYRFPAAIVEGLQRIRWWDWSEEVLNSRMHLMMLTDMAPLICAGDADLSRPQAHDAVAE